MNDEELRRIAEQQEEARSVEAVPRVIAMTVGMALLGLLLLGATALWWGVPCR